MATNDPTPAPIVTTTWMTLIFNNALTIMRYLTFAAGVFAAAAKLVGNHDWGALLVFFRSQDFATVIVVGLGGISIFVGVAMGGKNKQRVDAFIAALHAVGLNARAIDPTNSMPGIPLTTPDLIKEVVYAKPVTVAQAVAADDRASRKTLEAIAPKT